jgi:spore coat polysaccharide biosynthesis predicted glycosyltransferase SpsG
LRELALRNRVQTARIDCASYGARDARKTAEQHPDLLIIDGYLFESEFFEAIDGIRHVVLDDNVETRAISPSAVVNVNPHASAEMYRHLDSDVLLLLGLDFALIRRDIRERERIPQSQIVVSFGGTDVAKLTGDVAVGLAGEGYSVQIANNWFEEVNGRVSALHASQVRYFQRVDYPHALSSSRLAVLGGGGSLWEAAMLGVPSIAVIVAENQRLAAVAAGHLGFTVVVDHTLNSKASIVIEEVLSLSKDRLEEMSKAGRMAVDGRGAFRIVKELCK